MSTTATRTGSTHDYTAHLVWTGSGGAGTTDYGSYQRSYSIDIEGKPLLRGSAHPNFRGDAAQHDPEDLFLAAITSCHMLSYLGLCARRNVRVLTYEDRASGVLALRAAGGGRFTEVTLRPVVTLAHGADEHLARELHQAAHEACFIANSCSVPIRVQATVRKEAEARAAGSDNQTEAAHAPPVARGDQEATR
jgi:organic hydroperoxide reductase OsmC/OhrA